MRRRLWGGFLALVLGFAFLFSFSFVMGDGVSLGSNIEVSLHAGFESADQGPPEITLRNADLSVSDAQILHGSYMIQASAGQASAILLPGDLPTLLTLLSIMARGHPALRLLIGTNLTKIHFHGPGGCASAHPIKPVGNYPGALGLTA